MREMKDSGMSFIGYIPTNWQVDKIKHHLLRFEVRNPGNKQILSVYREYGVIPKDSRDDNHNVTSDDTTKYKYVMPDYFVINKMKAWQGSMGISQYEGVVSPAYFVYKFTDKIFHLKYFHYLLRNCYKDEFRRLSGGIREGQWDLPAYSFENTMVLIPSYSEQKSISDFLDSKCAQIDTLFSDIQTQIETLEQYKRSVIFESVTKGITPNVTMRDSGLEWVGKIPANWQVMANKYVMRKSKIICPIYHGEDILSLTMRGVIVRDLNAGGKMPTSFDGYQEIKPGNLLMCLFDIDVTPRCIGLIKQSGLTSPAYSQFIMNTGFDANYYCYYYTMLDNDKILLHLAKNLRHSLTEDQLGAISVIVPPYKEQQAIADYLDAKCAEIDQTIAQKQEQLDTLADYKRSLIYEYVTGKREVPAP